MVIVGLAGLKSLGLRGMASGQRGKLHGAFTGPPPDYGVLILNSLQKSRSQGILVRRQPIFGRIASHRGVRRIDGVPFRATRKGPSETYVTIPATSNESSVLLTRLQLAIQAAFDQAFHFRELGGFIDGGSRFRLRSQRRHGSAF